MYIYNFFTLWTLTLFLLYRAGLSPFNTFILNLITFIGGCCITYIYPKYIKFNEYKIKGLLLILCDILFHILPFYLAVKDKYYAKLTVSDIYLTLIVLLVYLLLNNPFKVYSL